MKKKFSFTYDKLTKEENLTKKFVIANLLTLNSDESLLSSLYMIKGLVLYKALSGTFFSPWIREDFVFVVTTHSAGQVIIFYQVFQLFESNIN